MRSFASCPKYRPSQIIAEPAQRNTAPAIALAAHILQSIDPKAVFGVFPSDHVIGLPKRYLRFVEQRSKRRKRARSACWESSRGGRTRHMATSSFPKALEAGGFDALHVASFREKPD